MTHTDVAIIGGGPAGLMLAIELGCRGVRCLLLEEDVEGPSFPKANATSSRTMEHYRRRGFSEQVRSLGLAADHPQDIVYCTTLAGHELARFAVPSRQQAQARSAFGDYGEASWPTPELPHRGQQMLIEPVLREQARRYPSVDARFGWRAQALSQDAQGARIEALDTTTGQTHDVAARYVVGCDGPHSLVRKTCGIAYSGQSKETREFFGGQMLSVYFRSPTLYDVLGKARAWQYWAVNPVRRGLLVAIDGVDHFLFGLQMAPDQTQEMVDVKAALHAAVGAPFDYELIAAGPWHAGFTLVADRFDSGRAFIAGDAAHLFTPTGGMGYNTSVDDVVNLGWKLAAVIQGWAPPTLLDSYQAERQPIAHRNTRFARAMADSIGLIGLPPGIDGEGAQAEAARRELGQALLRHVRSEFNIPGLQLGLRYEGSPIVAAEDGPAPPDDPNHYQPSARPGGRAPHAWVDGRSLFDLFGPDFTLLCLPGAGQATPADALRVWQDEAARRGLPLQVLELADDELRQLYEAPCALIRPDHHVAWRGSPAADPAAVLALATGAAQAQAQVRTAHAAT